MAPTRLLMQRDLNLNEEGQASNEDGPVLDGVPNKVPVLDVKCGSCSNG